MSRWFQVAAIGTAVMLLLSGPSGLRVQAQGEGGIIPPGEFSSKGDPPPDAGPFPKNRQDEPSVALNPTNAMKLAMGFNDWSGEPSCTNTTPSDCSNKPGISLSGFARSSNGGGSYDCRGRIDLSALGAFAFGDPSVAFDSKGNVYYATVGFPNNNVTNADVFVAKSTDGGCTYPTAVNVSGNVKFDDKDWIAVDINPNSPCRDNVYLGWTELGDSGRPDQVAISHSSDGGQTWDKPEHLSPANGVGRNGVFVKTDNGNVWVVWFDVTQGQPRQHMAISNDCGKNFDKHITVAIVNPAGSPYPGASFRVNSIPALALAPDGVTLYVAWADRQSGHSVIKVAKSSTKGLTWSAPVVAGDVNTTTSGFFASAFFPALDVDAAGNVNLAFLALKDKPAGTAPGNNVAHYAMFVRKSTDGGATWSDPLGGAGFGKCCLGDDPDASSTDDLKFQFLGDYITAVSVPAISGGPRRFLVAWTDTSSASTCDAVDAFRAGGSKPNVIAQCTASFGNTDVLLTTAFTY